MSTLSIELDRYLAFRRSLGYRLNNAERILRYFLKFAASEDATHITVSLFQRWKSNYGKADANTWAARYTHVRHFADWLHLSDERHELMPKGLFAGRYRRKSPYIYSEMEVHQIVDCASRLPSPLGIRGLCYSHFFGLIATAGLRISEAIAMDTRDVDFTLGVVTVREGKLGKSRVLPLSDSTLHQLKVFITRRDRLLGGSVVPLFVSDQGVRLSMQSAHYNFHRTCESFGLRQRLPNRRFGHGPRVHDLRHTFATRVILDWYKQGLDINRQILALSTYLGHDSSLHTYWYIEAVPELLRLASVRSDHNRDGAEI